MIATWTADIQTCRGEHQIRPSSGWGLSLPPASAFDAFDQVQ